VLIVIRFSISRRSMRISMPHPTSRSPRSKNDAASAIFAVLRDPALLTDHAALPSFQVTLMRDW
jgi:hypothetical protein